MNIVVLAGGPSPERDVSLSSGCMIANALMKNGHHVALIDLSTNLPRQEYYGDYFFDQASGRHFSCIVPDTPPDPKQIKQLVHDSGAALGEHVLDICRFSDAVFLALHGSCGENGQLQALFDMYHIRYTGSSYTGCILAMNKALTKELLLAHGIPTPAFTTCHQKDWKDLSHHAQVLGLPCVVKPLSCGSSIGVSIISDKTELPNACQLAFSYEESILLEQYVDGREFSVGILGGTALPPIEILPVKGFYNYKNKYQEGFTKEICPANLPLSITEQLKDLALHVHQILRLGSYSRIDFRLDHENNPWCLEANTLPGMTPTSLLPQEAAAAGISYQELVRLILEYA